VKCSEHRKNRTGLDSFCASSAVNFTATQLRVVRKYSMTLLWFYENYGLKLQQRGDSNESKVGFDVFGVVRFHFQCGIEAICKTIERKTSAALQTNLTTFLGGTRNQLRHKLEL
jgi:hypothetical protein